MRCFVKGKTFSEWASEYRDVPGDVVDAAASDADDESPGGTKGAPGGKKKESNTHYYATILCYEERKVEDIRKYNNHVTHCTPCNLDPALNYVSKELDLVERGLMRLLRRG
jgi:hypothetical protein